MTQREELRQLPSAKRLFDVLAAAAALLILAPVFAALALIVRLAIGAPILFKQQRPGLQGRPFMIYKFRTMSDARDSTGCFLPDAQRLGWFGRFLRSTSLDELPELINVLRGEMSLVGPRPLLMEYLPRYSAEQMRRHDVLPGITGFAQINGRNAASWPRKFELDVWYVDHWSMWLDLKIVAVTVWKVLKRDGINLSQRISSEPFMGNAEAAQSGACMIEREPTIGLVTRGGNAVGQPLTKAARRMAPCRIVDTDCNKLPVEKSEAHAIQMHGRRSAGAAQTLHTGNAAEWNAVLSKTHQHDFYHLPQYHRVEEQRGEGFACLFLYSENRYTIALPLLLRPVDTSEPEGWTDATSVYGYAGPVASHEWLPESFLQNFQGMLRDELSRARVVSVFSRLHPLIPQQEMLAGLGECVENGQTISIDLSLPEEEQRAHYKKDCRRRLRKLREAGFVCIHDREKRYLPEFVEVYHETMRRAGAEASYFFDRMYFEMLTRELDDVSHLFVVLKDHHVAAAVICTSCDGIVQDHLGGTRDAFLKFSPTRLAVDTARVWAKENGARVFHLGGGVGAQQDSLFEHKASFSDRRHTFFTWRWILQSDVYEELCSERERGNTPSLLQQVSAGYFPAYRCPTMPIEREGDFATASAAQVTRKGGLRMNNGVRGTNVLLTCAGRRSFAIRSFKDALNNCGRVFACDTSPDAPALQIADKGFVVPPTDAANYLDVLLTICRERRVRLLIPALEPELPLLAAHRARFLEIGTLPLVSPPEIVAICYDKIETAKFLGRCGLTVPRTYIELEAARQALSRGEITFPLVVKPRWGVSSIGLAIAEDDQELHLAFDTTEKQIGRSFLAQVSAAAPGKCVLIQERLSGQEYGLDIVNDLNGRYVCTFAKRKLKMRAGQTDRAVTVKDKEIEKLGRLIGEQMGHVGILDCDLFASDQGYSVIDLNPRIGGGYPFSHVAGANVPAALISWINGEQADPSCFQVRPDLVIARADEYVAIGPSLTAPKPRRLTRGNPMKLTQKQLI